MGNDLNIRKVLIIANYQKTEAQPLALRIESFLEASGCSADIFSFSGKADLEISSDYDLAITLGGDGTVLFAARVLAVLGIPVLPVNLGNFGFITEVSKDDWVEDLERILSGQGELGHRMMLEFSLSRPDDSDGYHFLVRGCALNDVVISGSGISKLINLGVHLDKIEHIEYRADGIIFSTATGSTAYSAAAGGPILHPEMDAIILNPICPFTLSHRPLVLPSTAEIDVDILQQQRTSLTLTVDGQLSYELQPRDRLRIHSAGFKADIMHSRNRSFYEVLRAKLNWSGGPE